MSNPLILEKMIEEAQESISKEQDAKRKLRNKNKAARQAARPQGKGSSKCKSTQKPVAHQNQRSLALSNVLSPHVHDQTLITHGNHS